ncbi:MAG: ATP-binding cassette, subfamily bacterial [Solirubrobacteraceae bacterium]|nr:ATP-binding cassette, subfamily bacterial [Solirubrobacteraceae bacterium]
MTAAGRLLRSHVASERTALGGAALSTIVTTVADLAQPWPLALVIDRIFADRRGPFELTGTDVRLLALVAGLTIAIALVDACAQYLADLWLQRAGERIAHRLRDTVYAHMQRLSLGFHQRSQKGDLVTRVTADVNAIGDLFAEQLGTMTQNLLLVAGMLAVVIVIDPVVALAAFATVPPLMAVSWAFRKRVRAQARLRRRHDGAIASMANEALSAMPVVKAFGTERHEHARIRDRSAQRMGIGMQLARLQARFDGAVGTLSAVGMALVIVVGVVRGSAGAVTVGDLVVLVTYARKAQSPLRSIAKQATKVASTMASAERIADVLGSQEIVEERLSQHGGAPARGDVELQGACFAYAEDRAGALTDVSLRIEAGTRVALIGPSGAGKTTIGALVARFYDPGAGRVLLDGRDLRDCSPSWLRRQVGVLLQDTVLFTGTVEENIAYGSHATSEQVHAAARAAAAHDFIESLPDGYATQLGPQGVGLSGGQRQRLGIARTLLRDPAVLVLDEPTTGLDAESQERVAEGLSALMDGRTTLLITHAHELARSADLVCVVEDGRSVRQGTPREILGDAPRAAGRAPVRDPRLPTLARMLDPVAVAQALERSLHGERRPDAVEVGRVIYKPGARATVHYRVRAGGERLDAVATATAGSGAARDVQRTRAESERAGATRAPWLDDELGALITWLPFDPRLPGMGQDAATLTRRLRAAGVTIEGDPGEPACIAYKPRSLAVLRFDGHVLKAYGRPSDYDAAVTGLREAQRTRLPTAPLEAAFGDVRLTVQRRLAGTRPDVGDAVALAARAGAAVRDLQRSPFAALRPFGPERCLADAARKAEVIAAVLPHLGGRVAALQRRLISTMPAIDRLVPAHGDFHVGALVVRGDDLAVVDFDAICVADPAYDLARYASELARGDDDDLERVAAALDPLLEGYGDHPPRLSWYLAATILGRAARPFQRQSEAWPERVEAMLATAQEVLD